MKQETFIYLTINPYFSFSKSGREKLTKNSFKHEYFKFKPAILEYAQQKYQEWTQLASEQTFLINIHRFESACSRLNKHLHLLHMLSMMSRKCFVESLILSGSIYLYRYVSIYMHVSISSCSSR